MARESWDGLTQLVFDSLEEDHYLNSPAREQHAFCIFKLALPGILARLASLPPDPDIP